VKLSQIVQVLNERFGTDFTQADQVIEDMAHDDELGDQARNNSQDQFKLVFDPKALDAVVARMERNEPIANTFMTDERVRAVALELMGQQVYERLLQCRRHHRRSGPGAGDEAQRDTGRGVEKA